MSQYNLLEMVCIYAQHHRLDVSGFYPTVYLRQTQIINNAIINIFFNFTKLFFFKSIIKSQYKTLDMFMKNPF